MILIEVSDATVPMDRTVKATAYALADIKEYWIVNIKARRLEVHLNPLPKEGIFSSVSHHPEGQTFQSPFAGEVTVSDLLAELPEEE